MSVFFLNRIVELFPALVHLDIHTQRGVSENCISLQEQVETGKAITFKVLIFVSIPYIGFYQLNHLRRPEIGQLDSLSAHVKRARPI